MEHITFFKPEDLFNTTMSSLLEDRVNRFYKEIAFVKNIRSFIKNNKDTNSFYITSSIAIKEDKICETYYFHNKENDSPFMSLIMNGYLMTTLHTRLVSSPKTIKSFNSFVSSVKKSMVLEDISTILSLFTLAFTSGGSDFILDACDDAQGQYMVLEAMKSKMTVEFFLFN